MNIFTVETYCDQYQFHPVESKDSARQRPIQLEVLMKSFVSALGMATAALAVATSAGAADLPSRKSAPVEYVRVCTAYGAGFFYIPGTDTCLRIGGRVRAEYMFDQPYSRNVDASGFRARGRLNIDTRTATAYGTLRAFIRYDINRDSGPYRVPYATFQTVSASNTTFLDKAFIQFGPITAGRAQSFFDFYANDLNWGLLRGPDSSTQLFAYTANFGGGFSATLSAEDGAERRFNTFDNVPFGPTVSTGGNRMPDIVANLNITQGWGSAQLSGAVHQITTASGNTSVKLDTEYGFAGLAGLKFNLPMLAQGDVFWLQGVYAEGASSYLGAGTYGSFTNNNPVQIGGVLVNAFDAVAIPNSATTATLKKTRGYALTAALLHYWTPAVRQTLFGSYLNVENASSTNVTDFKEYRIGSNLIWSPVSGLDIGVEVLYTKLDPKGRVADINRGGAFTLASSDAVSARLRVQRDF
ncbi:porin [Bosea sp. AS-1]|uniref:porin n=1 Tax=Bosea sp. AS-1 TaxID=2015316 RepID=UPI0012FD321C|nr:porin [Bosea sp. AS-1]